jgi:UDP-N-acetyl-alpha-D-quinovosamine dehydrogenase
MVVNDALVAVTGANGFVGRAFCVRAAANARHVRRLVRAPAGSVAASAPERGAAVQQATAPDPAVAPGEAIALDLVTAPDASIARTLDGVATLVHLAGRAHVMHETAIDPEAAYREANEHATARLARAAVAAGVKRFIFASTVKVNGEKSAPGRRFTPRDTPAPHDAYARSKLAAEHVLFDAARGTPMRAVALRLPLVYGPGARGNFRRLVDAVRARRWLPFGAIDNRRSVIGIDNLLDALDAAIDARGALEGVHFAADADSVSTPGLVRAIAAALHTEARLVAVPVPLLRLAGALSGRSDAVMRLTSSLEIDPSSFVAATAWRPRAFAIGAGI